MGEAEKPDQLLREIETACELLEAELWGFRMFLTEHLRRLREQTHGHPEPERGKGRHNH